MATTFDPNRVGPGTFQLVRDASTGTYSIQEVGFTKLPSLTLPDLTPTTTTTTTQTQDQTKTDTTDVSQPILPQVGGGGGGDRQDFTGESMFKNIQQDATGGDLMQQATQISKADISTPDTSIQMSGINEKKAYDEAVANYNNTLEINRDAAMGKRPGLDPMELTNARNEMDMARQAYEASITNIPSAPKIFDINQQQDIGKQFRSETDKFKTRFDPTKIEPAPTKQTGVDNIVKKIVDNSLVVNVVKAGAKILDAITPDPTAVDLVNRDTFKTRGELGSSTDPGRIAGNPATDLYAGMNRDSAFGNLEKAGEKRIATREATIARKGIKSASNPNGVSQDFVDNTNRMKDQQKSYKEKLDKKTSTRREAGSMNQPGRGGDQSGRSGGKSKIVCTMMNESYGFGSFRNKIWLRHSKNLAPEYQRGYHRLFLPLVNYAKQKGIINKIIKNILEHIAVHRTIDIRQQERNKIHLIGRVYRTILEPICYWAGKK